MPTLFPDPFESTFAKGIYEQRYQHEGETWYATARRVVHNVLGAVGMAETPESDRLIELIYERKFMPGGRYLSNSGRELHQVQNCLLLRAEDTREGWADLCHKAMMALMTGAGIGIEYSHIREAGALIRRTGGTASGPLPLMNVVNELGRGAVQGGKRRSAIWAGLAWWHPDVFEFIRSKNWNDDIRAMKEKDFGAPAPMDMTNISVGLDRDFFGQLGRGIREGDEYTFIDTAAFSNEHGTVAPDGREWREWAEEVYSLTVAQMVTTAEPGFSVNYDDATEALRNACTEITSSDDSDVCNLGSINLGAIEDAEEMAEATELGTLFLLAGTVYSDLPYAAVHETRTKNRRLGLGLMGVHEFLLKNGEKYGPSSTLAAYLDLYAESTEYAAYWATHWGISIPVKTRAIAPNGTIGILAETTTSAEPIFAAAYKRRVYNNSTHGNDTVEYEYVVDPVAARLIKAGVKSDLIEDAYSLSLDVERRVAFQAWLQQWVDHGISSTVNLPYVMNDAVEQNEFGDMLLKYLSDLRGITCYPDGSRGGQPLTSVPIEFAIDKTGVRYEEHEEACVGGLCGI